MKIRGNTVGTNMKPDKVLVKSENLTEAEKALARENIGATAIHVGTEPPTDPNVNLWVDTDEEAGGISTAEVGQTIVVKAIDDNGKPTAWECVDLPSGGGANLILFQCNGVHLMEVGMSWGEWCDSRYNTFGFAYDEDLDEVYDNNGDVVAEDSNAESGVRVQDLINQKQAYTTL